MNNSPYKEIIKQNLISKSKGLSKSKDKSDNLNSFASLTYKHIKSKFKNNTNNSNNNLSHSQSSRTNLTNSKRKISSSPNTSGNLKFASRGNIILNIINYN